MLWLQIFLSIGMVLALDDIDYDEFLFKTNSSFRLPQTIAPVRYTLTLEPFLETDLDEASFNGSVTIEMKISESTKNITLHSHKLNVTESSIEIVHSDGTDIKFYNTTLDRLRNFYIIHLEDELQKGKSYNLTFGSFTGTLSSGKMGFYLAKYKTLEGVQRNLALTQFEASAARDAFPCFDEPSFKAKFIVSIIRSKDYIAVSNEELATTKELGNGRFQDTFKETVVMSTYTVAFAISNYKHTKQNDRIQVLARPEAIIDGRADYILTEASKLLTALEDYTGINYTLNKLDLMGVPDEYFLSGAMENWGLIIFSEKYLLCSNTSSTTEELQDCTTFTAHELAHQWFGNLVTMSWWKYMWLNEGFAAYFQYYISDAVEPSWRLTEQYVTDHFQLVLHTDDFENTEPMNFEPRYYKTTPSSWITYYKACAVIRMTEKFLTKPLFKSGLRSYLEKNKFGSVTPVQLFEAFQQAVDEANANELLGDLTVSDILTTWVTNKGYPLITATRNYSTGAITLSQIIYGNVGSTHNSSIWYVPITYTFQEDGQESFAETTSDLWLTEETTVVDKNFTTDGWVLLNKLQAGYYRVNYDMTNWQRLIEFLKTGEFTLIHPINRAQLIDDAFSLAKSGHLSYDLPLNLSTYLIRETDLIPIKSFLKLVEYLRSILFGTEEYEIFQNYVKHLLSGALNYLGFEEKSSDTHTDKINRMNILKWLCNFGQSECKSMGLQKLRTWITSGSSSLSCDLEGPLLCGAIQIANQEEWNFLRKEYDSCHAQYRKRRYISSLACTNNENITESLFHFVCNMNNSISTSDRTEAIKAFAEVNNDGIDIVLKHLNSSCASFDKQTKSAVAEAIADKIVTPEQLAKAKALNEAFDMDYEMLEWYGKDNIEQREKSGSSDVSQWLLEYNRNNADSDNVV